MLQVRNVLDGISAAVRIFVNGRVLKLRAGQEVTAELKRMLTGFSGTTSNFNTIVRANEKLVRPFGINVTSAYGHHWAMFSLESADCHYGVEFRFPSGRISGHLKGTSFSQCRTVDALASIARMLSDA